MKEIQTLVAPGELWFRDDLEEVYSLLYRFLGFGRHSGARSHRLRAVAGAASVVTSVNTLLPWPLFAGLLVTPRNKDDMGDGDPTDQLSHNHCDCTDCHCNSHIVRPFVPSLVTGPSAAEAAQRLRPDEDVLDAPEEFRQPVVGVGGAQEEQGQERLALYIVDLARQSRAMVFAWWNPCIIRHYCAVGGGAGGAGLEEQGQERLAL